MTVALQEVLGLCGVEQGINRDELTGELTGDMVFGGSHGRRARPSVNKRTGGKMLRVRLLLVYGEKKNIYW